MTQKRHLSPWFRVALICTFAALDTQTITTEAFGLASPHSARLLLVHKSSAGDSSDTDDDELSKLIGKRNQIKRKKKDDAETEFLPTEPMVDLDLSKLPDFKTERPVRNTSKTKKDKKEDDKTAKKKESAPIIDYLADYDDENDFHIPNRIVVTTSAWGDPKQNFVPSGKLTKRMIKAGKFVPGDLQLAFNELLEGGITVIETSPAFGAASQGSKLSAENILKRCLEEQDDAVPETKIIESLGRSAWTTVRSPARAMVDSLDESLTRLGGVATVELFQAPKSFFFPTSVLSTALASVIESGLANFVGVQGVTRAGKLRKLRAQLEDRDVVLSSNSFEFSLTKPQKADLIGACKLLNIVPLITNPLDNGLCSGVYTAANPSGGQTSPTAKFTFSQLEKLQPLHSVQDTVAQRARTRVIREMRDTKDRVRGGRAGPPPKINTDITTTQVALQYVIAKGGVPVVPVTSPSDAKEVLGCLGWTLADDEVDMLDAAVALSKL